jgi:hypothetical protein
MFWSNYRAAIDSVRTNKIKARTLFYMRNKKDNTKKERTKERKKKRDKENNK